MPSGDCQGYRTDLVQYENGHRVGPLTWRDGEKAEPDSYAFVLTRQHHLQCKLKRDENLRLGYTQSMERNIEKGHPAAVPSDQSGHDYHSRLHPPYHSVGNYKGITELRTVLDLAVKHCGRSLNGQLHQGPDTKANSRMYYCGFGRSDSVFHPTWNKRSCGPGHVRAMREHSDSCGGHNICHRNLISTK